MPKKTFTAGEVLAAADVNDFLRDGLVETGTTNVATGPNALAANTTGGQNTAMGVDALKSNTTASNNISIGHRSLEAATTGGSNAGIGVFALYTLTTGTGNVAIGRESLSNNTTGTSNTAIGNNALKTNISGVENTALGESTLTLATSNQNVAVGRRAGELLTTGANNVMIGYNSQAAAVGTSNSITLGNSSHTVLRCQVTTITALSDQRDKKEIKDLEYGLDLINKVRPVEFTWDTRDGSIVGKPDIGFIAQELAEVEDSLKDTDRLGFTLRDNPEKLEATPGRLLPIAIKAIQELSAQNADLLARLEKLENK
jgi:hypothetical protein